MIKIKNLFYSYDEKFFALYDINLEIHKSTVIISDELSYKTLFRAISRQDKDYKGEIFIENKNLKEINLKDLSLSYITNPVYLLNKTVLKNIAYPLLLRKENKEIATNKALELMQKYNLQDKKVKECSTYEKILISFLRTVIRHPKLILIDDLSSLLTPEEYNIIKQLIVNLSNQAIVILALKENKNIEEFKNFNTLTLLNGKIIE